MCSVNKTALKD